MKLQIIPSIITKNQKELSERISKVKRYANLIHLDVMDGKFVRNKSLMFDFKLPNGKYEAHLMIRNPFHWIKKNIRKVDFIFLHVESENLENSISLIKKHKKKFGISLNPRTNLNELEKFADFEKILIMSVNPGRYGAKFLPSSLKKIREARMKHPKIDIEVDGGVNLMTIKKVKNVGANKFVVGSYLQKSEDVRLAINELKRLIK